MPYGRAAVFSAVCVGLAAAAHAMACGAPVSAWACVIGSVPVFALARVAAVRQRGLASITFLMLGCQTGLHVLFDAVPGTTPMAMGGMAGMGPVAHHASGGHLVPAAPAASHMSAGMLAGHAVAAVVVSWWLRRGEAMAFALAGRLASAAVTLCRAALLLLVGEAVPVPVAAMPLWLAEQPVPAVALIRFAVVRRGPPLVGVLV